MITLAPVDRPVVSFILVTFNNGCEPLEAVRSLVATTPVPFELVIIDNASDDGGIDRLATCVDGAQIIRNATNAGFGAACNQGALRARAPYLGFINPDLVFEPDWIEPLLGAMGRPGTAAVAPALMHVDGRMQEVGSYVLSDGSTRAFGDGDDADDPALRFGRIVDYASGACLIVERSRFHDVGGMDDAYWPAYYEDVVLAFDLARAGGSVRVVPEARVRHGRRAGTSTEAQDLLGRQRERFAGRRSVELARRPPVGAPLVRHRDRRVLDRLLVIDDRVPNVDRGAGDPRMAAILASMRRSCPDALITLVASDPTGAPAYAPALWAKDIEVVWGVDDWARWFADRRGHYDVVYVSRPNNMEWSQPWIAASQPQATLVYDAESLYFRRVERSARTVGVSDRPVMSAQAAEWGAKEFNAIRGADVVVSVSADADRLARAVNLDAPTHVLSHAVAQPASVRDWSGRRGVVFFGGFSAGAGGPNEDAVVHAVREVMPLVVARTPTSFAIVGSDITEVVAALADGPGAAESVAAVGVGVDSGVVLVGRVDDPVIALQRYRVHLCPLRFGAGLKLRLVDTMAAGLPFVTTPVGAEDLGLDAELTGLLVSDRIDGLAARTSRLLSDEALWLEVQARLRVLAAERYSLDALATAVDRLLIDLGIAPVARSPADSEAE